MLFIIMYNKHKCAENNNVQTQVIPASDMIETTKINFLLSHCFLINDYSSSDTATFPTSPALTASLSNVF